MKNNSAISKSHGLLNDLLRQRRMTNTSNKNQGDGETDDTNGVNVYD